MKSKNITRESYMSFVSQGESFPDRAVEIAELIDNNYFRTYYTEGIQYDTETVTVQWEEHCKGQNDSGSISFPSWYLWSDSDNVGEHINLQKKLEKLLKQKEKYLKEKSFKQKILDENLKDYNEIAIKERQQIINEIQTQIDEIETQILTLSLKIDLLFQQSKY